MIARQGNRLLCIVVPSLLISLPTYAQQANAVPAPQVLAATAGATDTQDQIASLKAQLAEQQKQLDQLRATMERQQNAIEKASRNAEQVESAHLGPRAPLGEVAVFRRFCR